MAIAGAVSGIGGIILLAIVLRVLTVRHVIAMPENGYPAVKVLVFLLFLLFVYSLMPLVLHLFVAGQGGIGNSQVGMVRFLRDHEHGVTYTIWGIFTLGMLIALPVMWTDFFGFQKPIGKKEGTITTNIGMTLEETVSRSTFKVPPGAGESLTGSRMSISQGVFDFEILGTGVRFENCRYCAINTGSKGDPKIVHINLGLSTRKLPRPEFAKETAAIIQKMKGDGWAPGHFERTDPDQIRYNSGARFGDGDYWLKGDTLLRVSEKRMDDPKPGEEAATAGEFIHVIDLLPREDASYKTLIFDPASS